MMKRNHILRVLLCAGLFPAGTAQAGTVSANMAASLTLPVQCSISATATVLDFGGDGLADNSVSQKDAQNTSISIQCSNGASVAVYATSANATGAQFRLKSGSNYLNYNVYMDSGRATLWPQSSGGTGAATAGAGVAQPYALYGRLPVQFVPALGTYTDTITLTVSY